MLLKRILTAIVLIVGLIFLAVFSSPFVFAISVALITVLAGMEWTRFIGVESTGAGAGYVFSLAGLLLGAFFLIGATPDAVAVDPLRVLSLMGFGCMFWILAGWLLTGYPANSSSWNDQSHVALMGIFVLVPTWCGIVQLKYLDESGGLVLGLIALVSIADIGAYFTGRAWGRRKLAPALSPGKSWAGFWGGMISCVAVTAGIVAVVSVRVLPLTLIQAILLVLGAVLVSLSSVVGDLFESMLKRNRNLKDSGTLLPGHGGILDRLDSLTAATPFAVLWLFLVMGLGG
ncbi:MAG: phosphatidate cytidylyltransferase [Gammaproteobacteria bacterium]